MSTPTGSKFSLPLRSNIPTYQFIFPGGDTQVVTNLEYRIPIFGPVILAAFFDAGFNKISRPDQLRLNPERVDELNAAFPTGRLSTPRRRSLRDAGIRASTGLELQVMMPVVNAPFRLYWAYNPLRRPDTAPAAGGRGSLVIPEPGYIPECDSAVRKLVAVRRKTDTVPFFDRANILKIRYHGDRYRRDTIKNSRSLIRL